MKKYLLGFAVMALFNDELVSLMILTVMVIFGACDIAKEALK